MAAIFEHRLIKVTDAKGQATIYTCDALDRVTLGTVNYEYNGVNLLIAHGRAGRRPDHLRIRRCLIYSSPVAGGFGPAVPTGRAHSVRSS
jgi:YD repeat-containing protein